MDSKIRPWWEAGKVVFIRQVWVGFCLFVYLLLFFNKFGLQLKWSLTTAVKFASMSLKYINIKIKVRDPWIEKYMPSHRELSSFVYKRLDIINISRNWKRKQTSFIRTRAILTLLILPELNTCGGQLVPSNNIPMECESFLLTAKQSAVYEIWCKLKAIYLVRWWQS